MIIMNYLQHSIIFNFISEAKEHTKIIYNTNNIYDIVDTSLREDTLHKDINKIFLV